MHIEIYCARFRPRFGLATMCDLCGSIRVCVCACMCTCDEESHRTHDTRYFCASL